AIDPEDARDARRLLHSELLLIARKVALSLGSVLLTNHHAAGRIAAAVAALGVERLLELLALTGLEVRFELVHLVGACVDTLAAIGSAKSGPVVHQGMRPIGKLLFDDLRLLQSIVQAGGPFDGAVIDALVPVGDVLE